MTQEERRGMACTCRRSVSRGPGLSSQMNRAEEDRHDVPKEGQGGRGAGGKVGTLLVV